MNKDKTGPEGKGPMTGRGMGPCSVEEPVVKPEEIFEENLGRGFRRGFGRGLGRGEGRRRRFW